MFRKSSRARRAVADYYRAETWVRLAISHGLAPGHPDERATLSVMHGSPYVPEPTAVVR
jgi:hypothetical protein